MLMVYVTKLFTYTSILYKGWPGSVILAYVSFTFADTTAMLCWLHACLQATIDKSLKW